MALCPIINLSIGETAIWELQSIENGLGTFVQSRKRLVNAVMLNETSNPSLSEQSLHDADSNKLHNNDEKAQLQKPTKKLGSLWETFNLLGHFLMDIQLKTTVGKQIQPLETAEASRP